MAYPQNYEPDLDDEDDAQSSYRVTASELRQFVERIERLESEIKDIQDQRKEVYAEAKGRGYDCGVLRKVVSDRKKDSEKLSEFASIYELYTQALGIL